MKIISLLFILIISFEILIAEVPNKFTAGEIVRSSEVNQNFEYLDNKTQFFRNFYHPEPLKFHETDFSFSASNNEGKMIISGESNKNIYLKEPPYCPTNSNPVYLYVDDIKLPLGGLAAPFIIPENKDIIAKAPNGENTCTVTYLKSTKLVTPILMKLRLSENLRFTVPLGKVFVLLSTSLGGSSNSTHTSLIVNDYSLGNKMSGSSWPFPMIFYRGTILDGPSNDPQNSLLINGYLIDE